MESSNEGPSRAPAGPTEGVAAVYERRVHAFDTLARTLARRSALVSHLRLGLAAGAVGALFLAGQRGPWQGPAGLGLFVLALAGFAAAVARHQVIESRRERARAMRERNREGLARVGRRWDELPEAGSWPVDPGFLDTCRDLDVVGPASLCRLLSTAGTPSARARLLRWLEEGIPPAERAARHAAVAELADLLDFRQELECATEALRTAAGSDEASFAWLAGDPGVEGGPGVAAAPLAGAWLRWFPWALAAASGTALLAPGPLTRAGALATWGGVLVVNGWLLTRWGPRVRAEGARAQQEHGPLRRFAAAFAAVDAAAFTGPEPRGWQATLRPARPAMAGLDGILSLFELGKLPLPFLGFFLRVVLLWDVRVARRLARWRQRHGPRIAGWHEAFRTLEAVSALAALRHDHPRWTFPEFAEDDGRLTATGLGHPLLPPERAVGNDVALGPRGRILMISGSNMSGKSTLLRALGLNALLANAGGPVCAERLRLPRTRLATSIRKADSLRDGVSLFLAELNSLKAVVDAAAAPDPAGRVVLYLLDEVLVGTNAEERRVIVAGLVKHLLRANAFGAASTHDLSLLELPEIAGACDQVHFREHYETGPEGLRMLFDYRLRPGVATTRNARALAAYVGLNLT